MTFIVKQANPRNHIIGGKPQFLVGKFNGFAIPFGDLQNHGLWFEAMQYFQYLHICKWLDFLVFSDKDDKP